jgi:hypothetical protein
MEKLKQETPDLTQQNIDRIAEFLDVDIKDLFHSTRKVNKKNILDHAGSISHKLALKKAGNEYDKYVELQRKTEHLESIKQLDTDLKVL